MYEIVVLDPDTNEIKRRLFRTTSYAKALGYLEQNLPTRPTLDMTRDGRFVDWSLEPGLMGEAS